MVNRAPSGSSGSTSAKPLSALATVASQPIVGGIANDAQQPGPRGGLTTPIEGAEGPQHGILHHVLGILRPSHQPFGEIVGGIEMRQCDPLEPCSLAFLGKGTVLPIGSRA